MKGNTKQTYTVGLTTFVEMAKQRKIISTANIESGGMIYSHGIAALCQTEAYGMTKDKTAQGSLN